MTGNEHFYFDWQFFIYPTLVLRWLFWRKNYQFRLKRPTKLPECTSRSNRWLVPLFLSLSFSFFSCFGQNVKLNSQLFGRCSRSQQQSADYSSNYSSGFHSKKSGIVYQYWLFRDNFDWLVVTLSRWLWKSHVPAQLDLCSKVS